jgi:hypothetical protein
MEAVKKKIYTSYFRLFILTSPLAAAGQTDFLTPAVAKFYLT